MTEEDNLDEDMYSEDIEFTPADDSVENLEQELEKEEVVLGNNDSVEFSSSEEFLIGEETKMGDLTAAEDQTISINALGDMSYDDVDRTDLFSTTENYVVDEETSSPQFTSELEEKDIESMVIPQMGLAQTAKIAADAAALEVQPPDGSGKIVQRTDGELQQAAANLAGYQPETEKLPANSDGLGATPRPSQALNRIKTLAGELKNTRFGFG